MSDPQTTNKTATAVNTVLGVAINTLVTTAESFAVAEFPWLGWPGIKQIWQALFSWIAGKFIIAAQTESTFIVIDMQVNKEESDISKALAAIVAAQKSGDAVALQAAIKVYANANSALVHSDGSANPTG